MSRRSLLLGVCALLLQSAALRTQTPAVVPRSVLDKYCVACHNERLKTAGLLLDKADVGQVGANAELWERVVRKLRSGEMPPPGSPRPDTATYAATIAFLEKG